MVIRSVVTIEASGTGFPAAGLAYSMSPVLLDVDAWPAPSSYQEPASISRSKHDISCKAIVRGKRVVADLYPDSIAGVPAGPDGFRRKGPNLISGLEVREMSQACLCTVQPVLPSFNTPVQPWINKNYGQYVSCLR